MVHPYYSGIFKNEVASQEKAWRNIKCILLSKIIKFKNATYYKIPPCTFLRRKEQHRVKSSVVVMGMGVANR